MTLAERHFEGDSARRKRRKAHMAASRSKGLSWVATNVAARVEEAGWRVANTLRSQTDRAMALTDERLRRARVSLESGAHAP